MQKKGYTCEYGFWKIIGSGSEEGCQTGLWRGNRKNKRLFLLIFKSVYTENECDDSWGKKKGKKEEKMDYFAGGSDYFNIESRNCFSKRWFERISWGAYHSVFRR